MQYKYFIFGFNPSIPRHSGFCKAADAVVLSKGQKNLGQIGRKKIGQGLSLWKNLQIHKLLFAEISANFDVSLAKQPFFREINN